MSSDQITKEKARKILEAYFLKQAIGTAKHTARVATFTEQSPGDGFMINPHYHSKQGHYFSK